MCSARDSLEALLGMLSKLPKVETWAVVERLNRSPGAALFMGMAVTANDLEDLIPLDRNLGEVQRFLERVQTTPPAPALEDANDDFI